MSTPAGSLLAGSAATCLATWLVLAFTAGGVALQRSISKGALTLFDQPTVIVAVAVTAFVVAFASATFLRLRPWHLAGGVILGDLVAGLVLAPIAVGELEPIHAPLVFAAVSVLGVQPAAAPAGAWLAGARSRSRRFRSDAAGGR